MGCGKICSVCGQKGHNKRYHTKDKCSRCHKKGHKAPTCKQGKEKVFLPVKQIPRLPEGFSLRRDSSKSLTKRERNMTVRMLHGLYTLKAQGKLSESVISSATRLSGIGKSKIIEINNALVGGKVVSLRKGKRGTHKRKDCFRDILSKINDTIEKLHKTGTMTCTRKILNALNFYHGINELSKTILIKLLHKMGYSFRKPSAGNVLLAIETKPMRDSRLKYLRAIKHAREEKKTVVYIDESYVNDRHQAHMCWLKKDSEVYVPSGRGPRYILYGAGSENGWVEKPTVFVHKDGAKDYHTGMNGQHFEELFLNTCIAAREKLGHCVIIMDNAAYHRRLVDERCRMTFWNTMPAEKVKEAWASGEVPGQDQYTGGDMKYKKDIIQWLRHHLPEGETRVEAMAREHGHSVVMLPPYRPELNAIETAWAVAKNYVAFHNSARMPFSGLKYIIDKGMEEVTLAVWTGLNAKVMTEEQRQLEYLESDQAVHDQFRAEHPDLAFTVGADDTDDESDDETVDHSVDDEDNDIAKEVLAAVSEGVDGTDEDIRDILGSDMYVDEIHDGHVIEVLEEVVNHELGSLSERSIGDDFPDGAMYIDEEPCNDAIVPVTEIPNREIAPVEDLLYFLNSVNEVPSGDGMIQGVEATNPGLTSLNKRSISGGVGDISDSEMYSDEEPCNDAIVPVAQIPNREIAPVEDLLYFFNSVNEVPSGDGMIQGVEATNPGLTSLNKRSISGGVGDISDSEMYSDVEPCNDAIHPLAKFAPVEDLLHISTSFNKESNVDTTVQGVKAINPGLSSISVVVEIAEEDDTKVASPVLPCLVDISDSEICIAGKEVRQVGGSPVLATLGNMADSEMPIDSVDNCILAANEAEEDIIDLFECEMYYIDTVIGGDMVVKVPDQEAACMKERDIVNKAQNL